ncbi:hypothetical protein C8R44DRAFT_804171 [Mycena epipterygia]|nr:hypothetical protein C8R44DRAFT_804171 [Mycena epipterygia]
MVHSDIAACLECALFCLQSLGLSLLYCFVCSSSVGTRRHLFFSFPTLIFLLRLFRKWIAAAQSRLGSAAASFIQRLRCKA